MFYFRGSKHLRTRSLENFGCLGFVFLLCVLVVSDMVLWFFEGVYFGCFVRIQKENQHGTSYHPALSDLSNIFVPPQQCFFSRLVGSG